MSDRIVFEWSLIVKMRQYRILWLIVLVSMSPLFWIPKLFQDSVSIF